MSVIYIVKKGGISGKWGVSLRKLYRYGRRRRRRRKNR